ncbi:MAG: hypothetical protein AB1792_08445 [Candidatus Zixiibacteriota bacterium]
MGRYRALTITIALTAASVLVLGCGAEKKESETAAPKSGTQANQAAQPYAIDWCIVSGEKLGGMGAPVSYQHQGRELKFCCKGCIKDFEREPARYLARLDSAVAGQIQQPHVEEEGHGG